MTGNSADLRRSNRAEIVWQLARHPGLDRQSISDSTGLTGAAVSRITRELIDAGVVQELPATTQRNRAGRRTRTLHLHKNGAFVVAIVITANRKSVSLADCGGELIEHSELELKNPLAVSEALEHIVRTASRLMSRSGIDRRRLIGASVLVAANTPATRDGKISSTVLGWHDVSIAAPLQRALQMPVCVTSRSAALLETEMWRSARGPHAPVVLINIGLAMSTSILIKRRLLESDSDQLGQLSHMAVANDPTPCECGAYGCLGQLATGNAVIRMLKQAQPEALSASSAPYQQLSRYIELAASRNRHAVDAFGRAGQRLSIGIHAINALLRPHVVYLAGETGRQADFVDGVQRGLSACYGGHQHCPIAISNTSSVNAAVRIALNRFVLSERLNLDQLRA